MKTIDIDFDVFKAITARRHDENTSENDVLRELLGLPAKRPQAPVPLVGNDRDWVTKGVRFPEGTELRAGYKGRIHNARVERGALVLDGKKFDSPSAAAISITGNPVNGWTFWEARLPGQAGWKMIKTLRQGRG
jgi:hypothetical protein